MSDKIAVVTGANKGIGLSIVQELCRRGVTVYLTGRDLNKCKKAVEKLNIGGLYPLYHQLDVTDSNSVKTLAEYLKAKHGGLDILINNAGIIVEHFTKTTYDDAKRVIDTNYRGNIIVQEHMFPILNENARVINVSSCAGHIAGLRNPKWIQRLTKKDIDLEDVNAFVDWFLNSVKNGNLDESDFKDGVVLAYKVSKIALSALTRVQQRKVGKNISVNSIHPGLVKTDMGKGYGVMTVDEAGKAPAYLALDVDQSVKGRYFWYDKTEKDWTDPNIVMLNDLEREEFGKLVKESP